MRTIKKILPVVMSVAMIFSLAACGKKNSETGTGGSGTQKTESNAEMFPDFKGKDFDGNDIDQSLFSENEATILNFWFNGCSACVNEMPELEKFNEKLREKGATIVGVNSEIVDNEKIDEERLNEAKDILSKQGVSYKNIFITEGPALEYTHKIFSYPTTVIVDKSGKIIGEQIIGAIDSEKRMSEILDIVDKIKSGEEPQGNVSSNNSGEEEISKLLMEEGNLFIEHKDAWDKVFAQVQKDNTDPSGDYVEFLKSQIENVKDKLTEDELKTLNADLEKITEIEKKVAELKNQN